MARNWKVKHHFSGRGSGYREPGTGDACTVAYIGTVLLEHHDQEDINPALFPGREVIRMYTPATAGRIVYPLDILEEA